MLAGKFISCFFTFRELAHLEENSEEYVSSIEWIDHGNLAFGDSRNRVQIWDVESGKALRKIRGHASRVSSLAVGKGDQEMVKNQSPLIQRLNYETIF